MIDLIKVSEAAAILKVSKQQIYLLCDQKLIPHLRLGGKGKSIRIDRQELVKWIEEQHEKSKLHTD